MNLDKVCRLCLEEVKPLLNLHEPNIAIPDKIRTLSSVIEIKEGDGLPDQVCQLCMDQLETCHKFMQKCEKSDYTLRQYLLKEEGEINAPKRGTLHETSRDGKLCFTAGANSAIYFSTIHEPVLKTSSRDVKITANGISSCLKPLEGQILQHSVSQEKNGEVLNRLLATAASNGVEIKAVQSPLKPVNDKLIPGSGDMSLKLFGHESVNFSTFFAASDKMKFALPSSSNQEMIDPTMLPFIRYSSLLEQQCKTLQTKCHRQRPRRPIAHQKPHSNRAVIVDCYNCALRCHEKLGAYERAKIHEEFHELEDYAAQRSYINSRVERFEPRRRRTSNSRRKISQIFTLEYNGVIYRDAEKEISQEENDNDYGDDTQRKEGRKDCEEKNDFHSAELDEEEIKGEELPLVTDDELSPAEEVMNMCEVNINAADECSDYVEDMGCMYDESQVSHRESTAVMLRKQRPFTYTSRNKPIPKVHSCDECGKAFGYLHNLKDHKLTHSGIKAFACNVCNKKFPRIGYLKIHTMIHTGEKPHNCEECGRKFTQLSSLKKHYLTHTGDKPHVCDICYKRFAVYGNLMRHKIIHTGQKLHTCDICKKSFADPGYLKRHRDIHIIGKRYVCEVCNTKFSHSGSLRRHRILHSGGKVKSHKCDTCGKAFAQSFELNRHKMIHTGEKPHGCEMCQKSFSQFGDLKRHKLLHTGERPYICDICPKSFACSSYLKRHKIIHRINKPHKCESCSKTFAEKRSLRKHMLLHRDNLLSEESEEAIGVHI